MCGVALRLQPQLDGPMTRTSLIAAAAVVAVALVGVGLIGRWGHGASAYGAPLELTSGRGVSILISDKPVPAPSVALADLEGRPISKDRLQGKVVRFNFLATWCETGREESPMLIALQQHYHDQLVVIGLSVDERPAAEVKKFAEQLGVNYPVAMASEEVQQAFGGISAVPSTFVSDPDGRIVLR